MFTNKLTICIPVFERYDFFEEAITSALNQTISCNILVVDNASSHDKFEVFCKENNINYYKNNQNLGMYGNWNKCIELCSTEWMTILHDDDALSIYFVEFFQRNMLSINNAVAYAVGTYINAINNISKVEWNSKKAVSIPLLVDKAYFLRNSLSPFPGVVFKTEVGTSLNYFDESLFPIGDLDFWYRLSKIGRVYLFSEILAYYRISKEQGSFIYAEKMVKDIYGYRMNLITSKDEESIVKESTNNLAKFYSDVYQKEIAVPFFDLNNRLKVLYNKVKTLLSK